MNLSRDEEKGFFVGQTKHQTQNNNNNSNNIHMINISRDKELITIRKRQMRAFLEKHRNTKKRELNSKIIESATGEKASPSAKGKAYTMLQIIK